MFDIRYFINYRHWSFKAADTCGTADVAKCAKLMRPGRLLSASEWGDNGAIIPKPANKSIEPI